jgi:hypothetical protein
MGKAIDIHDNAEEFFADYRAGVPARFLAQCIRHGI